MSTDPHEMVVSKGVRYRVEDAKRLGITPDARTDVAALEAALAAEKAAAEEAERVAAEKAAAEEAERVAAEKAKTPANKARASQTKGQ